VAAKLGLRISGPKTKVVSFGYDAPVMTVDGTAFEVVPAFVYLGSSISGDSTASSDDVECRIGKAAGAFTRLKVCVWKRCNIRLTTKMKIFNAVVITTLLYASECWTLLATDLTKLEVFQMSCLRQILGVTRRDRLRNDTIRHRCKKQPTVEKRIQRNRLRWFGHVCRMDDSRLPKRLLWAERPDGWRCPLNAPRNNGRTTSLPTSRRISPGASTVTPCRVAVWYDICLHCRATAADMTAERGACRGLWYDITGIKRRRDDSSERAHPDATSVDG